MKIKRLFGKVACAIKGHSDLLYMRIEGAYKFRASFRRRNSGLYLKRTVATCCSRCGKVLRRKPLRAKDLAFFNHI